MTSTGTIALQSGSNDRTPISQSKEGSVMSIHPHHDRSNDTAPSAEGHDTQSLGSVFLYGLLAGAAGVAAMTIAEKLEQTVTKRPNSYVPAHTLEHLLRLPYKPDDERLGMNWTMHWGQGIALGAVRAFMAHHGIRGPVGSFIFMNLRLINDQTLENATGVGAPPWTWPRNEQVIDLTHKAVYAFATGAVADYLIPDKAGDEQRTDTHRYDYD
jgi:hypothetical protein